MSSENQETVADIVAWIRRHASVYGYDLADRIEAAYSRLPILTPEQWTQVAQQAAEMSDLKRENARLRAALKPVLECDCQLDNYPTKEAYMAALDNSINEAKRIYNGGGEKQKEGAVQ